MNITCFTNHCCGCGECSISCPKTAIKMEKNSQGFYYPSVDSSQCIDCTICVEACAFNRTIQCVPEGQKAYAVKHKDAMIRAVSRSGGMFSELVNEIFRRKGVVYGCVLTEDNTEAKHIRAVIKKESEKFHGSKYIQSNIVDCYKGIKKDLEQGRWVLFSGTACQVNAVKDYCSDIDNRRLLLVDIVCHGAPSQRVWKDYLNYVEKKKHKPVVSVDFRDKQRFGWAAHVETFTFKDGSTYSCDYFKELFYAHYILREDCFNCPFKNLQRQGDITLADCWGIAQNEPEFDDDKGVSLVLVNNDTGRNFFDIAKPHLNYLEVDVNDYLQPPLKNNWEKPAEYDAFWEYYYDNDFKRVIKKYVPDKKEKLSRRIIGRCKKLAGKLLKKPGY